MDYHIVLNIFVERFHITRIIRGDMTQKCYVSMQWSYHSLTLNLFNKHPFHDLSNKQLDLDMHISETVGVTSDLREMVEIHDNAQ